MSDAPQDPSSIATAYYQNELGLTPEQARGAVRWMRDRESGLDPAAFNPAGGGQGAFGIGQWRGPRQAALLAQYGEKPSLEQQLEFSKSELLGPEAAALARLRQAQTEGEAFHAFGQAYERPGPGSGYSSGLHTIAGSLGPMPDFAAISTGLARQSNPLTPPVASPNLGEWSSRGEAGPTASPMALATLLAAGTHKAIPVSYDPFKGQSSADARPVPIQAGPSLAIPDSRPRRLPVPYLTQNSLQPAFSLPSAPVNA